MTGPCSRPCSCPAHSNHTCHSVPQGPALPPHRDVPPSSHSLPRCVPALIFLFKMVSLPSQPMVSISCIPMGYKGSSRYWGHDSMRTGKVSVLRGSQAVTGLAIFDFVLFYTSNKLRQFLPAHTDCHFCPSNLQHTFPCPHADYKVGSHHSWILCL